VGTIALATTGAAGPAHAAKAVVEKASDTKKFVGAAFAIGAVAGLFGSKTLGAGTEGLATGATITKINEVFPGALPNKSLVSKATKALKKYDYGSDSLIATSFCADEVNRCLEAELGKVFTDNFSMGGLAGFPFGGVTSFGAMAAHIPDGGSCLVVFGPHVGVDSAGSVGTVERRGRANGGACCGSAVAASGYVASVLSGDTEKAKPPADALDAQQSFVGSLLLPHAARLDKASDKMVELPYALYDAQKEMMTDVVTSAAGAVAGSGKIAVMGGIQINTPPGQSDYYLPLSFEVYDNTGTKIEDLTL
jgi:hypothetical protein